MMLFFKIEKFSWNQIRIKFKDFFQITNRNWEMNDEEKEYFDNWKKI